MRAEPDKLKGRIIRLAVDQNEVGSDVAVAVIAPLAAERMIEIPSRQWLVLRQDGDGFEKQDIEALGLPSGFLAPVIAAKRLVYLTIRIQAREQLLRRAYGRKLAAPRGLHCRESRANGRLSRPASAEPILHSAAEGDPNVGVESSWYDTGQNSLSEFPSEMKNPNGLVRAHFLGNPIIYI